MKTRSKTARAPSTDAAKKRSKRVRRRGETSNGKRRLKSTEQAETCALLSALAALKNGDFAVRLPLDWLGIAGKAADTFNEVVALNQKMAEELARGGI